MKYLGAILVLCIGANVRTSPVANENIDVMAADITSVGTIGPDTAMTGTAPTEQPASGKTVSAVTIPPATGVTNTAATMKTATTGSLTPVSIVPIKTTLSTFPTNGPTPAPQTGFDGASFGGGIALGIGLCVILAIVYKVYTSRRTVGYKTM